MRNLVLASTLLLPLYACDQPQGDGSSSQQGASGTSTRASGNQAGKVAAQPQEIPKIGPRGDRMAGSQPQPATGTVPNDASGPMSAPNSLNSGASDPQLKKDSRR